MRVPGYASRAWERGRHALEALGERAGRSSAATLAELVRLLSVRGCLLVGPHAGSGERVRGKRGVLSSSRTR